jgi:hypothetical protein
VLGHPTALFLFSKRSIGRFYVVFPFFELLSGHNDERENTRRNWVEDEKVGYGLMSMMLVWLYMYSCNDRDER